MNFYLYKYYYVNFNSKMNIAIVGYRNFNDYELFSSILNNYITPGSTIISGGCTGTDTMAEKYADEHKLDKIIFNPNPKLGAGRFHARNRQIVDKADRVIAFLHTESKGTIYTINYAQKNKKPIMIFDINVIQNNKQ